MGRVFPKDPIFRVIQGEGNELHRKLQKLALKNEISACGLVRILGSIGCNSSPSLRGLANFIHVGQPDV